MVPWARGSETCPPACPPASAPARSRPGRPERTRAPQVLPTHCPSPEYRGRSSTNRVPLLGGRGVCAAAAVAEDMGDRRPRAAPARAAPASSPRARSCEDSAGVCDQGRGPRSHSSPGRLGAKWNAEDTSGNLLAHLLAF